MRTSTSVGVSETPETVVTVVPGRASNSEIPMTYEVTATDRTASKTKAMIATSFAMRSRVRPTGRIRR